MNLLESYQLQLVEYLKQSGEIFRTKDANEEAQAKVELKLTPIVPSGDSFQKFGHIVQANLNIQGFGQQVSNNLLFTIELRVNACYRPLLDSFGQPFGDISFERFQRLHTETTRQLLPLLNAKTNELLYALNIGYLRLPFDLAPPVPEAALSPEIKMVVH